MINVVDGEYGATANTLQQVSGELQGAKIDDLSEAVESSMKGADSIAKATEVEGRYTSLLVTHSTALEELARAAHAAGVNLAQTEANNTQQANAQGHERGAAAPATASSPSPEHPIIDVDGEKWLLTEPVTVIGRGTEADITVADSGVSRRHLELRITPTGVIATDLGSTNGTFVEGHRIDAATLLDGNQITIGRTRILFWTHPQSEDAQ